MRETIVPGVAGWSRFQPDRGFDFNAWYVRGEAGTMVVDPLEPDADIFAAIDAGGLTAVVITNRDHERAAHEFVERYRVPVIAAAPDAGELSVPVERVVGHGEVVCGWRVTMFDGLKTAGEFALVASELGAAIVGDALWGVPAGAVRLMPDEKLADPSRAVLSLRQLLAASVRHLLLGDGMPVYERAADTLQAALDARGGVLVHRINLDELEFRQRVGPGPYRSDDGEIGFWIGARRLGYRVVRLAPGNAFCPYHWHTVEEELYVVWDGTPTLRTPAGTFSLQRGDLVAFPLGPGGAHRLSNESGEPCTVLMLSNTASGSDGCFYPDSRKVLVEHGDDATLVRAHPQLDYYDGE